MKIQKVVYGEGLTVSALIYLLTKQDSKAKIFIHKDHKDTGHSSLVVGGFVIKQVDVRGKSPNLEGVFETYYLDKELENEET